MITPTYVQTMAQYNRWQNSNLIRAGSELDESDLFKDQGSFFGSIIRTCSHLIWGDSLWLSRFHDFPPPEKESMRDSVIECQNWDVYCQRRADLDAVICDWAGSIEPATLDADLCYYSGAAGRDITKSTALLVTHFFNHQTHHRGQIHAMLTALGVKTADTDIPFMPDERY